MKVGCQHLWIQFRLIDFWNKLQITNDIIFLCQTIPTFNLFSYAGQVRDEKT
jgi:hypothetical protein